MDFSRFVKKKEEETVQVRDSSRNSEARNRTNRREGCFLCQRAPLCVGEGCPQERERLEKGLREQMIFQIWLTLIAIFSVLLGAFWLLIRRPLLRRLRAEAELAKEERLCQQQRAEARKAAERELSALLDAPQEAAQEEQRLQKEEHE